MAAPRLRPVEQLGLDEHAIDDKEVEAALETREKRKHSLDAVRKQYTEAHDAAKAAIQRLELPEGAVARVGRFRITRKPVPARVVSFETKSTSRIQIALVEDD